MKQTKGSISVYFLIIFVPIFCFQAVLTDWARIKIAEHQTEAALKAALRSVMAQFDAELLNYGLFGQSQELDKQQKLFSEMLQLNLTGGEETSEGFSLAPVELDESPFMLTGLHSLADQSVFKQQILEDMKYRAPIEFTLQFMDKLDRTSFQDQMNQASTYTKQAQELEALIQQRNEALIAAFKELEHMHRDALAMNVSYNTYIQGLDNKAAKLGDHTEQSLEADYTSIVDKLSRKERSLDSKRDRLKDERSSENPSESTISRLKDQIDDLKKDIKDIKQEKKALEQLIKTMAQFKLQLMQLQELINDDQQSLQEALPKLQAHLKTAKQKDQALSQKLEAMQSEKNDLKANEVIDHIDVFGDRYFDTYTTDAAAATAAFEAFRSGVQKIIHPSDVQADSLRQQNDSFQSGFQKLYNNKLPDIQELKAAQEQLEDAKAKEEQKYRNTLRNIQSLLGVCGNQSFQTEYGTLNGSIQDNTTGLYQKYRAHNLKEGPAMEGGTVFSVEQSDAFTAEEAGDQAMNLMDTVQSLALDLRDEMYINEFALSKFSYRTLGEERDQHGKKRNNVSTVLSNPMSHPLQQQEAEYILYGFDSCFENYSAAASELFLMRLAIRTMEALTDPKKAILSLGSPMLVLIVAVAQGAVLAADDVLDLLHGKEVVISAKLPAALTLNYKDYLRIFMLLHGRLDNMMYRMMALVELNTGKSLDQAHTYLVASAESKLKLWYMPVVMDWMGKEVSYRHAIVRKQAVQSY